MGAANVKIQNAANSEEQPNDLGFVPFCMDCDAVCYPKKGPAMIPKSKKRWSENKWPNMTSNQSGRAEIPQIKKLDRRDSANSQVSLAQEGLSDKQPPIPAPTQGSESFSRSQSATFDPQPNRPIIPSSLSFKGNQGYLDPGWERFHQDRFTWAMEEVCRRSGIPPPGLRATQKAMAARAKGSPATSTYDMRLNILFGLDVGIILGAQDLFVEQLLDAPAALCAHAEQVLAAGLRACAGQDCRRVPAPVPSLPRLFSLSRALPLSLSCSSIWRLTSPPHTALPVPHHHADVDYHQRLFFSLVSPEACASIWRGCEYIYRLSFHWRLNGEVA